MDLIYQNADRVDQVAMRNYEMDLAYGRDENDFSLAIDLDEHCLEEGYILYIEGTEYGGIVDKIKPSNVDDTVYYSGRTWHGILEGKVFEPIGDNDYLLLNGDAHEVLREQIETWGLTDLFAVAEGESIVRIVNYKVRYAKGYTGTQKMLYEFGGKLVMAYKNGKVLLSVEPYIDYSQDEEFDSSQLHFALEKDFRPLNHLICTGVGESDEPYTIHLFCDQDKGLQAYASVEVPIKDSDYILTKENQKLFGKDEYADTLDAGSVQAVKNYVLLEQMPDGWNGDADSWNDRFPDIYTLDEESKFKQAEAKKKNVYELQLAKPSDWNENFKSYFIQNGEDEEGKINYEHQDFEKHNTYKPQTSKPLDWESNYFAYYTKYITYDDGQYQEKHREVQEVENPQYFPQNAQPSDWATNYKNYFTRHFDGVNPPTYSSVSGITETYYVQQTSKPSDWSTNYGSYYQKSGKEYVKQTPKYKKEASKPSKWNTTYMNYYTRKNDGTGFIYQQISSVTKTSYELQTSKPSDWATKYADYYYKKDNKYEKVSGDKAPAWKKKKYYTKKTEQVAPTYNSVKPIYGAYAPAWKNGPKYTQYSRQVAPKWVASTYYSLVQSYVAPEWKPNTYYTKIEVTAPEWVANTYYTKVERMVIPPWSENVYYRQHLDHYAKMVEKGIESMRKAANGDKLEISLELENIYDINDIVGATEHVTNQSVWVPITKKIVKITDTTETVEYEVGE